MFLEAYKTLIFNKVLKLRFLYIPYWPGYHRSTHIGPRLRLGTIWGSRDDKQATMEMPMY
jgi:hypothetical protein